MHELCDRCRTKEVIPYVVRIYFRESLSVNFNSMVVEEVYFNFYRCCFCNHEWISVYYDLNGKLEPNRLGKTKVIN